MGINEKVGFYMDSWIWRFCARVSIFITILASRILQVLNTIKIVNNEQLYNMLEDKNRTRPILTYANHVSLSDPYIFAGLLKWRYIYNLGHIPWVPSARDVLHRTKYTSLYFRLSKSIPLDRGAGVFQPTMDYLVDRVNKNDWIHVFPEGIARLITESTRPPIIIPMFFVGTDDVLPMKKPYKLKTGQRVTVLVGEPVEFSEHVKKAIEDEATDKEVWTSITDELRLHIDQLEIKARKIHDQ